MSGSPVGSPRRRAGVLLVAVALVAAACSGPRVRTIPPPETEARATTTTTSIADPRAVQLPPVEGTPDPGLRIEGGESILRGTVVGPEGAVPGAIVRIVRVTSAGEVSAEVATNEFGQWELLQVQGGVYRIRAHLPPRLTVPEPQVFFLEAGQERTVDLTMQVFDGIQAAATVDPPEMFVGATANVTVVFALASVAEDGTVVRIAVQGRTAQVSEPANLRLLSRNPESLDGDGRVSWAFECLRVGATQITVALQDGPTTTITGPDCVEPPPPDPPPDPPPGSDTSTSVPTSPPTTTATTATTTTTTATTPGR